MALLQNAFKENTGGTSATTVVTLSATTKNSTIIVPFVYRTDQGTFSSIKDSTGVTYSVAITPITGSPYAIGLAYRQNAPAGITSVTLTCTGGTPVAGVWTAEESGVVTSGGPLDATAIPVGQVQVSPTSWSSGNMAASTSPNLVLYGFSFNGNGTNVGFSAGASWTAVGTHQPLLGDGDDTFLERRVVSAAGVYAATGSVTTTSTQQLTLVAAFVTSGFPPVPESPNTKAQVNALLVN